MKRFHLLHYSPSAMLIFVGAKMLLAEFYEVPTIAALGIIAAILLVAVIASLMRPAPCSLASPQGAWR